MILVSVTDRSIVDLFCKPYLPQEHQPIRERVCLPVQHVLDSSLIKKRTTFNFSKVSLRFDVSESLFSSFDVDVGTKALLNSLRKDDAIDYSRILDLGCGYGPIGLFLKAQDPSREVHMVDRDALAAAFTTHNAQMNELCVKVYPSLDYQQTKGTFSLIVTNFPAKAAVKGLQAFVYGASSHLTSKGVLALVVVRELTNKLKRVLNNLAISVLYEELKKGYSIYHLLFSATIPTLSQKYERQEIRFSLSRKYTVKTAFGLAEFDSLSFGTRALFSLMKSMKGYDSVLVLEPCQGHSAIGVMDLLKPAELTLCSRDMLSITFAERNVKSNFPIEPHTVLSPYFQSAPKQELIVWNIQRKEDLALNNHNLKVLLKGNKSLLIHGKTSLLSTLLKGKPVTNLKSVANRNFSAQLIMPK